MRSPVRKINKSRSVQRSKLSEAIAESLIRIASEYKGVSARNQRDRIMEALLPLGSVTTIETRKLLDVLAPVPRILVLCPMGKRIATHVVRKPTDYGKVHHVGLDVLES